MIPLNDDVKNFFFHRYSHVDIINFLSLATSCSRFKHRYSIRTISTFNDLVNDKMIVFLKEKLSLSSIPMMGLSWSPFSLCYAYWNFHLNSDQFRWSKQKINVGEQQPSWSLRQSTFSIHILHYFHFCIFIHIYSVIWTFLRRVNRYD